MDILKFKPKTDFVSVVLLTDDSIYEVAEWIGADRLVITETLKTQHERIPRKSVEFFFSEDENGQRPYPSSLPVTIGSYIVRAEPNRFEDHVSYQAESPANLHEHYLEYPMPKVPDEE